MITHGYSRGVDFVSYPKGIRISIRLGLNFDQVITNSAMTHVLVLSVEVRRNERLWRTLNIGNMFGPNFGFKNSQSFQFKE